LNEVFDALPACRVQRSPMPNMLSLVTALIKPAGLSHRWNGKGQPSRAAPCHGERLWSAPAAWSPGLVWLMVDQVSTT